MTEDTRSTCRNVCECVRVWGWHWKDGVQANNGVVRQAGQLSNDRYQLEQRARRLRERERLEVQFKGKRTSATNTSTWASPRVDKEPLTKDNGQRTAESKTHADENLKNTNERQQTICGYLSKQVGRAAVAIKIGDRRQRQRQRLSSLYFRLLLYVIFSLFYFVVLLVRVVVERG